MRLFLAAAILTSAHALAAGGIVKGVIRFEGKPPAPKLVNRSSDPACNKGEARDEAILLGKNGKTVQNVVIRVKDAPAPTGYQPPKEAVVMDQSGCMYRPRVQAAVAGQPVVVKNSDGTYHNVHTYLGRKTLANLSQPAGSPPLQQPAPPDADVIKFKCDVHPWMTGFVALSKNPYFQVTGDGGTFELKDVPSGTWKVEAWHEKLGTQTAEVKVEEGKTAELTLTYK